jgi:hypothetical protein
MKSQLAVLADDARERGHRTLAEKAFATLQHAIITGQLEPANNIAGAMGGAPLYQLGAR